MDKYILLKEKNMDDIQSTVFIYEHIKTKAKVVHIKNDDSNKGFLIQFRTLPESDNGICHILEHSVLSGSRKFDLKEPFVELLKASMNTFLNAMTYPDKTVYPFSTMNKKEYLNLMDVYLDAVFFPNIYRDDNIMNQEGWHYEIDEETGKLNINGVVYNEMKGVFAQPDQLLYDYIKEELYDNVYHMNSGGDPKAIPTLTHDEFKAFHKKYYHPSNSVTAVYGDVDIEEVLDKLDEYIGEFEEKHTDITIKDTECFERPKFVKKNYPIIQKSENQSMMAVGYVQGHCQNVIENNSMDMINDILFNLDSSPVKKAILESGLAQDVFSYYDSWYSQPATIVVIRGMEEENAEKIETLIFDEIKKVAEYGIDSQLKMAMINNKKFSIKEGFDSEWMNKGLILGMISVANMDRGVDPIEALDISKSIEYIESNLDNGYLEQLINKYYVDNNHRVSLVLAPDENLMKKQIDDFENEMKIKLESLSNAEKEKIKEDCALLLKRQTTPDKKENIEKLPILSVRDIEKGVRKFDYTEVGNERYCISSERKGISYLSMQFEIRNLKSDNLKYVSLLATLMDSIGTKDKDYAELSNEIKIYMGNMSIYPKTYFDGNKNGIYLDVFAKYLNENMNKSIDILFDMINNLDFSDINRILTVIQIDVQNFEMNMLQSGDSISDHRLGSYFNEKYRFEEYMRGIDFYEFIKDLAVNFEERKETLIDNLKKVYRNIFNRRNLKIFYQGDAFSENMKYLDEKINSLCDYDEHEIRDEFKEAIKNEAYIIPAEVNYISRGYDFTKFGQEINGSMLVSKKLIDTDYLWEKVRVQGGAYGCYTNMNKYGHLAFSSYRDPNVANTISVYENIVGYLQNLDSKMKNVDRYIIGTIGMIEKPVYNENIMKMIVSEVREGNTEEKRNRIKNEIIETTINDIMNLKEIYGKVMSKGAMCAVGSSKIESEAANIFEIKTL